MKTTTTLICLLLVLSLAGCGVPWQKEDPNNRMRKSPCAALEVENEQRA